MKSVFFLFFILAFGACATKYRGNGPYDKFLEGTSTKKTGITFLTIKLYQNTDKGSQIQFSSKLEVEGELKETYEYLNEKESKYVVQLLDIKGRPLKDFYLDDVLNPRAEVFNENGEIKSFQQHLSETEIVLRFNSIEQSIDRIVLFEIDSIARKEHFIGITNCK